MVPDVGFLGLLTHCRPGLTRMVATCGGYRPRPRSVLVILPIGAHRILAEGAVKPVFV